MKEIRDKVVALAEYPRQAKDTEMLRDAVELRLRAEHRAGVLLAAMEKAKPRGSNQHEERSRSATDPPTLANLGVTKTQSSKWQKLAAMPEDKFEIRVAHAKTRVEGMTTSAPSYSTGEYAGEDDEWFTPPGIIEPAREALGGIDLDPASHAIAQQTIAAATFYTVADNGLIGHGSATCGLTRPSTARCSPCSLKSSSRNTRAARSSRRFAHPRLH